VLRVAGVGPRLVAAVSLLTCICFGLVGSGVSDAAGVSTHLARITFLSDRVTFTPPINRCPVKHPACQWMLFVNEPATGAIVGTMLGTTGTLSVAYPVNFCGVIQADVLAGPLPWRQVVGHRHTIQTATTCSSSLPFVGGTTAPTRTTAKGTHSDPAQLPFTGIDIEPLSIVGITLVTLGLLLVTDLEHRRRMRRRLGANASALAQWLFQN